MQNPQYLNASAPFNLDRTLQLSDGAVTGSATNTWQTLLAGGANSMTVGVTVESVSNDTQPYYVLLNGEPAVNHCCTIFCWTVGQLSVTHTTALSSCRMVKVFWLQCAACLVWRERASMVSCCATSLSVEPVFHEKRYAMGSALHDIWWHQAAWGLLLAVGCARAAPAARSWLCTSLACCSQLAVLELGLLLADGCA